MVNGAFGEVADVLVLVGRDNFVDNSFLVPIDPDPDTVGILIIKFDVLHNGNTSRHANGQADA